MTETPFPMAQHLVNRAKMAGQWIYDPKTKQWWTPEEFEMQFIRYVNTDTIEGQAWLKTLVIRDPKEYPIEFVVWLEPLIVKAAAHAKKIKIYYKPRGQNLKVVK